MPKARERADVGSMIATSLIGGPPCRCEREVSVEVVHVYSHDDRSVGRVRCKACRDEWKRIVFKD